MYQKNVLAVRIFSLLMKIASWIQALPGRITPPPFRLVQIGSAFWQSRMLYVAAHLDIATVLADEELEVDEIAARVSSHPDATCRLLRALSAMGIFAQPAASRFANNALSSYLREDNPQNIRAMILMHNSEQMSLPWYQHLEQSVKSGDVPFRLAHGAELFDYMDKHAEFAALFSRAMDSVEALSGDSFATDFAWQKFDRIIDVGGSRGSKALSIIKRHPHIKALVVDSEQVINEARNFWQSQPQDAAIAHLSFEAGDVLSSVPAAHNGRDIYLLSAVLHGFSDEDSVLALQNIARGIGASGARVALLEMVIDDPHPDITSSLFDMQVFMGTRGRERTMQQWQALFLRAGLQLEEVISLRSFGKILLLHAA